MVVVVAMRCAGDGDGCSGSGGSGGSSGSSGRRRKRNRKCIGVEIRKEKGILIKSRNRIKV